MPLGALFPALDMGGGPNVLSGGDKETVALACLKCVKVNFRLRVLEQGKEVAKARIMALEEVSNRVKDGEGLHASLRGNKFMPLL